MRRLAVSLVSDRHDLTHAIGGDLAHAVEHLVGVVLAGRVLHHRDRAGLFLDHPAQRFLQFDDVVDPLLGGLETARKHVFGDLRRALGVVLERLLGAACLHHHHGNVAAVELATGHDHLERGRVGLFVGGKGNPLAVGGIGDAHTGNRALERYAAQPQGRRRAVQCHEVIRIHVIRAQNRAHDVGVVAVVAREVRPQRAVDQPAHQDRIVGCTPLSPEERAGNPAHCVHALLDVDGEREERCAVAWAARRGRGDEHLRVADAGRDRPVCEPGKHAGLEGDGLVGARDGTGDRNGFSHVCSCCGGGDRWSAPKAELCDQSPVPLDVVGVQVVEQPAPSSDELQQPSAAVVILVVGLEVFGEVVNPGAQLSDLHLGRSGIGLGMAMFVDHRGRWT